MWTDPDHDTSDAYRACVRDTVDFGYACRPSSPDQWVAPGPDGYIPFGVPKEQGSILATTERSVVKDNRRVITFSREVDSTGSRFATSVKQPKTAAPELSSSSEVTGENGASVTLTCSTKSAMNTSPLQVMTTN